MDWGRNHAGAAIEDAQTYYVDLTGLLSNDGQMVVAQCRELPVAVYETTYEAARESLRAAIQLLLDRYEAHGELERYLEAHDVAWQEHPNGVVSVPRAVALDPKYQLAFYEYPVTVSNLVRA